MKKKNFLLIMILIVMLFFIGLSKLNLIELIIEQNRAIQISFYVIVACVIIFLGMSYVQKKLEISNFKRNSNNKNTTEEFDKIYNLLKENLESKFKETKKKFIINAVGLIITAIVVLILGLNLGKVALTFQGSSEHSTEAIILFVFGLGAIYFTIKTTKHFKEYYNMYKYGIIGNMVKLLNENLDYGIKNSEIEKILKNNYLKSEFETDRVDTFSAEDFIAGNMIKDVYIILSDIYVQRDADEKKQESKQVLFKGLFATTTINKNINSTIKLLTDKLKFVEEQKLIKMDNSELEELFDLYAENQMLVMRVMTPEIMDLLTKYFKEYKIRFEIIIKDTLVYFRFHTENMFETKIIEDPFDKKKLFLYYNTLKLVLDLTEKFNRNLNELSM